MLRDAEGGGGCGEGQKAPIVAHGCCANPFDAEMRMFVFFDPPLPRNGGAARGRSHVFEALQVLQLKEGKKELTSHSNNCKLLRGDEGFSTEVNGVKIGTLLVQ